MIKLWLGGHEPQVLSELPKVIVFGWSETVDQVQDTIRVYWNFWEELL